MVFEELSALIVFDISIIVQELCTILEKYRRDGLQYPNLSLYIENFSIFVMFFGTNIQMKVFSLYP